mmetsp:Transcript_23706/g.55298  ORF Transcript_23706/g.55298 Transcript_23706/m.55298 type:complete len:109 (-) Transcript_23706:47-373(-)
MKRYAPFDERLFDPDSNSHLLDSVTITPAPLDARPVKLIVNGRDEQGLGRLTRLVTAEWLTGSTPGAIACTDVGEAPHQAAAMVEAVQVQGHRYEFVYMPKGGTCVGS